MAFEDIEDSPEFDTSCAQCGFALHTNEIAAEIIGIFVDYFQRIPNGEIRIAYCSECWEVLKSNASADIRTGIAKRRAMENQDKYDSNLKDDNTDIGE